MLRGPGRSVKAPDGRVWRVRRRWLPRLRDRSEFSDIDVEVGVEYLWASSFVVGAFSVIVGVFVFLFLNYVFFALQVLAVPLLALAREVFRQPWTVEATAGRRRRKTWKVVGWLSSREAIRELKLALARGEPLPRSGEIGSWLERRAAR